MENTITTPSLEGFANEVLREMQNRGYDCSIMSKDLLNGGQATGIRLNKEGSASPVCYLEGSYDELMSGTPFNEVVDLFINSLVKAKRFDFEESTLTDWNCVAPRLRLRLIGRKGNDAYLKNVPYLEFGDLAVICYVQLDSSTCSASTKVTKGMLKYWEKDITEVFDRAKENSFANIRVSGMFETLARMNSALAESISEPTEEMMYVCTGKDSSSGVPGILDTNMLSTFASENGIDSFFIIPSSIHELIFVKDAGSNAAMLNEMIQDVNISELESTDILSNHYYEFNNGKVYDDEGNELILRFPPFVVAA